MPLIDRRTDAVVLRIVYDGPPEAGKTTNLQQLCERLSMSRRGPLESPGGSERTQFFDWLDVTGGYVAGRRVRCQLVTVPGQAELARRRRHLLDSADVVVFVVDSRPGALAEVRASLEGLRRALARRADIPLLIQANKQDLPDAADPAAIVAALGLEADTPVIEAEAAGGVGVLETFMLAVRLAVDRVRGELVGERVVEGEATGAAELLEALEALDAAARGAVEPTDAPVAVAIAEPEPEPEPVTIAEPEPAPVAAPAPVAVAAPEPITEPAPAAPAELSSLPRTDVSPGLVWPPLTGRTILRAVRDAGTPELVRAGVVAVPGWRLFRAPSTWRDVDDARRALLEAVGRQAALAPFVPAERVLVVGAGDDDTHVLWYVVAAAPTLADARVADDGDAAALLAATSELVEPLTRVAGELGVAVELGPTTITIDGRRYLGPAWPGAAPGPVDAIDRVRAHLEALVPRPVAPAPVAAPDPVADPHPVPDPVPAPAPDPVAVPVAVPVAADLAPAPLLPPPTPPPAPVAAVEVLEIEEVESLPITDADLVAIDPADDAWEVPSVDLPAGMVWPLVRGRAALAALGPPITRHRGPARPWAPADAIELRCDDGWRLHTAPAWWFGELDHARHAMIEAVRWQTRLGDLTPGGRTLALCPTADGGRLWVVTPDVPSCWDRIAEARAAGDAARLAEAIAAARAALDEVRRELARLGVVEELSLDVITVDTRPRLLLTPPSGARPSLGPRLDAQLAALAAPGAP